MTKIEFGFGTELDCTGSRLDPERVKDALYRIDTRALDVFGGFTAYDAPSGWRDPKSRRVYRESGRTLMVLVDELDEAVVTQFANFIKRVLDQEAVAVTTTGVSTRMI